MEKKKILLTAPWPEAALAALKADYTVLFPKEIPPLRAEILDLLKQSDAFCPTFVDSIDKDLIAALPDHIRLVASFGVGVNHIDLVAAKEKGLIITNTPGVVSADTADITIGLMIAALRGFYKGEKVLRAGQWQGAWNSTLLATKVSGKTLGIIGLGRIGEMVARRARAFDMEILYFSRTRKPALEKDLGIRHVPRLEDLLAASDIISLHAPLSPETRHLINAETLKYFKPGAFLINTSRGGLVDEAALVSALKTGRLGGAGLDVYEFEPALAAGLKELENVTILPHLGTATLETRTAMGLRVKENLDAFFQTGKPLDSIGF